MSFNVVNYTQMMEFELPRRFRTLPCLDGVFEPEEGMMCVVVGTPGAGKTRFSTHIVAELARKYGHSALVASPEMNPRVFGNTLRQYMAAHKCTKAGKQIALLRNDQQMTVQAVLKYVEAEQPGIKWLVLDPYNQFETDDGKKSVERRQMEDLGAIGRFKDKTGIGVIIVAHPTKAVMGENGRVREPTAYDISGSAHFYNRSDLIGCLTRHTKTNKVKFNVQKIRNQEASYVPSHVWMQLNIDGTYAECLPPEEVAGK